MGQTTTKDFKSIIPREWKPYNLVSALTEFWDHSPYNFHTKYRTSPCLNKIKRCKPASNQTTNKVCEFDLSAFFNPITIENLTRKFYINIDILYDM